MKFSRYLRKRVLYCIAFIFLALLLTACVPTTTPVPPTLPPKPSTAFLIPSPTSATPTLQSSPTPQPVYTPTLNQVVVANKTPATPCGSMALDYAMVTLPEKISRTYQIVVGEVVKVDPLVWDTGDGQPPANICITRENYRPEHQQLAPIQVQIKESFKGNLQVGTILELNVEGMPGALPGIVPGRFSVKQGETLVWFLDDARGPGWPLVDDPTYYKTIAAAFKFDQKVGWTARYVSGSFKDIAELQSLVQHPQTTPSPKK